MKKKKLRVTLHALYNVSIKPPERAKYIQEDMKQVYS